MLEQTVDEKYYLKESTIRSILASKFNSRHYSIRDGEGIAACLRARDFHEPQCVQVGEVVGGNTELKVAENFVLGGLQKHQTPRTDGLSPTLTEAMGKGGGQTPVIVAMRGRNPDNPSDRTAGAPTEQRLEENTKGLCNALTTVQKDNLVMEKGSFVSRKYSEFIEKKGYIPEMFVPYNSQEIKDLAPTLTTQCTAASGSSAVLKLETPIKVKVATKQGYDLAEEGDYINITYPNSATKRGRVGKGVSHTLTAGEGSAVITENVRIRKLTPRECLRLMGWKDCEIDKIQAAGISATQQYRQAGNGICVPVLVMLFKNLFKPTSR